MDFFCGAGGWTIPAITRGYHCIGFDTHDHAYPGELRITTLPMPLERIRQLNPAIAVFSPPCEDFARCHLPWLKTVTNPSTALLQWSIQTAKSLDCPALVECSKFAARHVPGGTHCHPYVFWGDVPALFTNDRKSKQRQTGTRPERRAMIDPTLADWIVETLSRR